MGGVLHFVTVLYASLILPAFLTLTITEFAFVCVCVHIFFIKHDQIFSSFIFLITMHAPYMNCLYSSGIGVGWDSVVLSSSTEKVLFAF